MARILVDPELERRLARNIAGISLPKYIPSHSEPEVSTEFEERLRRNVGESHKKTKSSSVAAADITRESGRPIIRGKRLIPPAKSPFGADKKFTEQLQTSLAELLPDLRHDDIATLKDALQKLSAILSDNEDLHEEISSFLSENKIPSTFASKLRDIVDRDYFTDKVWSLLGQLYGVVDSLVSDDNNVAFILNATKEGFVHLTTNFLDHVLAVHERNPVYTKTVISALKTLSHIFLHTQSVDVEDFRSTVIKYCQSRCEEVREVAKNEMFKIDMVVLGRLFEEQDSEEFTRLVPISDSKLAQVLLLISKRENFTSMILGESDERNWKELYWIVNGLVRCCVKDPQYTVKICQDGVVGTIHKIMCSTEIFDSIGISTRADILIKCLLQILLQVTTTTVGKRKMLLHDVISIASTILNSRVNRQIKDRALALVAILYDFGKPFKSAITFDATPDNIESVAGITFTEQPFTEGLESKIRTFLVDSGFAKQLCTTLAVSELAPADLNSFCMAIVTLTKWSTHSKEFIDIMFAAGVIEKLKAVLLSEFFTQRKNKQNIRMLIKHSVQLLNVFALYGYEDHITDKQVIDRLHSLASQRARDDYSEVLKLHAKSFFVLTHQAKQIAKVVDKKDVQSSSRFVDVYIQTYVSICEEKAMGCLIDSLPESHALEFITGPIRTMTTASRDSLPKMIVDTMDKFILFHKLATIAVGRKNTHLSKEFVNSDFAKLVFRLVSDVGIVEAFTSKDIKVETLFTSFLEVNLIVMVELLKQEENSAMVEKANILPELLLFTSGTIVRNENLVGKMWIILAKMWSYGGNWPIRCGVTSTKLTERIVYPETLEIMMAVMRDDGVDDVTKTALVDMLDKETLVRQLCKEVQKGVSEIKIHSDRQVNEEFILLLDCLYVFSLHSQCFKKIFATSTEYNMLIDVVLGGMTDPQVMDVDEVGAEYSRRCLRLLLVNVEHSADMHIMINQHCLGVLDKWAFSSEPFTQMLALSGLSLLSDNSSLQTYAGQSKICKNDLAIQLLQQFTLHSVLPLVDEQPFYPDIPLRVLFLLAHDKMMNMQILRWFDTPIFGDIIKEITSKESVSSWEYESLKCTTSLVWLLSTNAFNTKKLLDDPSLVDALQNLVDAGEYKEMENAAFCALLEITGIVPEHQITQKEKYDVTILGPERLESIITETKELLRADGYRVVTASFSLPGMRIIDTICSSEFLILFKEDTEPSLMCRTVINHAHRRNTPIVGVSVGKCRMEIWLQSALSPQKQVVKEQSGRSDLRQIMLTIRKQLPKANLSLVPERHECLEEFDRFVVTCSVGDKFMRDNFVGSVFDHRGGYLKLPSQEVILYIPPGAIEAGRRQHVYCHGNSYKCGGINTGKVVLSPVVHCGPDGAKFMKEVVLTFPHCAVNESHWNFTALTKPTRGTWDEIPDDMIIVKDEFVYVFLDHFTGFTAEGNAKEGKTAQRRLTIGAGGKFQGASCCQIHIGAWCDTGVHSECKKIPGTEMPWQLRTTLTVSDTDTFLSTNVTDIENGWKQRGSNTTKMIRLADVGTDKEPVIANCQYTFQYKGENNEHPNDFFCTVSVTSEEKNDTTLELVVPNSLAGILRGIQNIQTDNIQALNTMSNAELFRKLNEDWNPLDSRINEELWRQLCELLDVKRDGLTDWRGLAGKLELTCGQIESLSTKENPTSRLLLFYFTTETIREEKFQSSLDKLRKYFNEMENHVARDYISGYMEKLSISDRAS